jgi:hypothetical protein
MRPRFEPDGDSGACTPSEAKFVDPESFDASEQRFTASLEEDSLPAAIGFVPDEIEPATLPSHIGEIRNERSGSSHTPQSNGSDPPLQPGLQANDGDSWRQEVASRVNRYRARRRGRGPRYASLQLEFETTERSWENNIPVRESGNSPKSNLSVAIHPKDLAEPATQPTASSDETRSFSDAPGKILPFPRMAAPPPVRTDELADPVLDGPRIIEVPEVTPPPPALGGILMEPAEEAKSERRPGFELPLQAAPMSRRLAAAFVDSLLVGVALAGFEYGFFRITAFIPPLVQTAGISAGLAGILWFSYQYLLLVFSATTPGLKVSRLRLNRFDGSAVPRSLRRWRVLASALSALSLGLGYAWCFLDEDQLSWHDRITRTYMAPGPHAHKH